MLLTKPYFEYKRLQSKPKPKRKNSSGLDPEQMNEFSALDEDADDQEKQRLIAREDQGIELSKGIRQRKKKRSVASDTDSDEEEEERRMLNNTKSVDESFYLVAKLKKQQQGDKGSHEHGISEYFIHQLIEVIEFVLGTVSNTASYLRLWALSLAHSQLAKVFYEKTIGGGIEAGSVIGVIIGFIVFIPVTGFVLMFMDVMECFLHDLRLHWVEFQNKFFKGQGYRFNGLAHERVLFPSEFATKQ
jgi:V-type H+-transporting ATPase subunit a